MRQLVTVSALLIAGYVVVSSSSCGGRVVSGSGGGTTGSTHECESCYDEAGVGSDESGTLEADTVDDDFEAGIVTESGMGPDGAEEGGSLDGALGGYGGCTGSCAGMGGAGGEEGSCGHGGEWGGGGEGGTQSGYCGAFGSGGTPTDAGAEMGLLTVDPGDDASEPQDHPHGAWRSVVQWTRAWFRRLAA
jgi:hypothetical protein